MSGGEQGKKEGRNEKGEGRGEGGRERISIHTGGEVE